MSRRRLLGWGAIVVGAAAIVAVGAVTALSSSAPSKTQAAPKPVCTRFASPQGNDGARGTKTHPFRTVQRLVNALRPGGVGCLMHGTYAEDVTIRRGGVQGTPITLRAAPGLTATVRGRLWIAQGADWVTIAYLKLDGRNANMLPSPTVNADHTTFTHVNVTNNHAGGVDDGDGICFDLGDPTGRYGFARYTTIEHSRIHDCGTSNNHNHGIYVNGSDHATIVDNWIYNNADRGIQLYPDAHHTLIENNIIAGNGEGIIFSGDDTYASSDNVVTHNIIVDSTTRHNVEYWWPGPVGTGNVITENCIYGSRLSNIQQPQVGYTASDNLFVSPRFLATRQPSAVAADSPCASYAPRG